ncbi:MAG: hypothetical protein HYV16_08380 [Gammaproteobacteria bacterium]|nr:hypothetical protein [Gammaproteobacteria bacterium]
MKPNHVLLALCAVGFCATAQARVYDESGLRQAKAGAEFREFKARMDAASGSGEFRQWLDALDARALPELTRAQLLAEFLPRLSRAKPDAELRSLAQRLAGERNTIERRHDEGYDLRIPAYPIGAQAKALLAFWRGWEAAQRAAVGADAAWPEPGAAQAGFLAGLAKLPAPARLRLCGTAPTALRDSCAQASRPAAKSELGAEAAQTVLFQYTQFDNSGSNISLGYAPPLPMDSQLPVDGFRSYASLHARHQALDLASSRIAGQQVGATENGRAIWAYVLSDADGLRDDGRAEPAVMLNAGIHAREWSTPEVATGLMERFAAAENDAGLYQFLLDNTRIVILPVLNVDGFLQTQRFPTRVTDSRDTPRDGRMRRKNMRGVDESLDTLGDNLLGIDLNRNNEPFWASSTGSSGNPSSLVYHGPAPASESETRTLQTAAELAQGRLRLYVDTHSFSQVFIASMTGNGRRDALAAQLASRMRAVAGNRYAYDPGPPGSGIGTTDEYFAHRFQIPSYTLETEPSGQGALQYGGLGVSHDGFILPNAEIRRVREELADTLSLGFYRQAGPPGLVKASIVRVDTGAPVYLAEWRQDGDLRRQDVQRPEALAAATSYRLRLQFDKPMRHRVQGSVADYPGQGIALAPSIALEGKRSDGTGFSLPLASEAGGWQTTASGFARYRDDTFLLDFSLAADSPALSAPLLQLAVGTADLAGQLLDSNPATPVDWSNGGWSGYERDDGVAGDSGGTDRRFRLKDDGSPLFIPSPAPTPTPTPPPAGGSSGGGGGALGWLVTFVGLHMARRKRIIAS